MSAVVVVAVMAELVAVVSIQVVPAVEQGQVEALAAAVAVAAAAMSPTEEERLLEQAQKHAVVVPLQLSDCRHIHSSHGKTEYVSKRTIPSLAIQSQQLTTDFHSVI